MNRKELIKIIIKVLIYALGLIGAYLGVSAMTSCTMQRNVESRGSGIGIFQYTDTFRVEHGSGVDLRIN
mgnify:CR=1 FL=1